MKGLELRDAAQSRKDKLPADAHFLIFSHGVRICEHLRVTTSWSSSSGYIIILLPQLCERIGYLLLTQLAAILARQERNAQFPRLPPLHSLWVFERTYQAPHSTNTEREGNIEGVLELGSIPKTARNTLASTVVIPAVHGAPRLWAKGSKSRLRPRTPRYSKRMLGQHGRMTNAKQAMTTFPPPLPTVAKLTHPVVDVEHGRDPVD